MNNTEAKQADIKQQELPKTFEERLNDIGFDSDNLPKGFKDIIMDTLLNEPVLTHDGRNIDKATYDKTDKNTRCSDGVHTYGDGFIINHALKDTLESIVTNAKTRTNANGGKLPKWFLESKNETTQLAFNLFLISKNINLAHDARNQTIHEMNTSKRSRSNSL